MRFELQLARGLMAVAMLTAVGGLAAMAPAGTTTSTASHPVLVCPSPATVNPIEGVASLMAPAWRAHLPALIKRRPA